MTFDKSKVYTSLNAEELEVGSEVILGINLESLKHQVEFNSWPTYIMRLDEVLDASAVNRFKSGNRTYNLAYLVRKVEEAEQKEEKWIVYLAKEQDFSRHLDCCAESFWAWGDAKPKLFVGTHEEAKEWCQSRRKFLQVIKAWEDGKQIQLRRTCFSDWINVSDPLWDVHLEYRVKLEEDEKWIVYLARPNNDDCYLTACTEDFWDASQKDRHAKTKLFIGSESKAQQWYETRQKFTEVIKAWEDGKQIQYWDKQRGYWFNVNEPSWNRDKEYRVKPNGLVWTDLKMGDILWRKGERPAPLGGRDEYVYVEERRMVTGIVDDPGTKRHIQLGGDWIDDEDLEKWSVEE